MLEEKLEKLQEQLTSEIQAARDASMDLGAIANLTGGKRDQRIERSSE